MCLCVCLCVWIVWICVSSQCLSLQCCWCRCIMTFSVLIHWGYYTQHRFKYSSNNKMSRVSERALFTGQSVEKNIYTDCLYIEVSIFHLTNIMFSHHHFNKKFIWWPVHFFLCVLVLVLLCVFWTNQCLLKMQNSTNHKISSVIKTGV